MAKQTSSQGTFRKFMIALVIILFIALAGSLTMYYLRYFGPNVTGKEEYLYIHTGENFDSVYKDIRDKGIVSDSTTFIWAAHNMKYVDRVKPGKYHLHNGMSNRRLINMLASGTQEPVTLSFHNLRLKEQFAGFVSKKLEPDSTWMDIRLGENYKQLDFTQQDLLSDKHIYLLELINSRNESWYLKFEYRKGE